MKILIAPNSMKGSLNASDFADIVEKAFLNCSPEFKIRKIPVADGGDFTCEILKRHLNAKSIIVNVENPFGKIIESKYAISEKTAIIEMADASGMKLVSPNELNPLKASSIGTGQLISDAIEKGCTQIYLAIGGSATVDGGMGMMEGLGFTFYDKTGKKIKGNGENLSKIYTFKSQKQKNRTSIKIICDVDNLLLGKKGAAAVFGPQKGATASMVNALEKGLTNWSKILEKETNIDVTNTEGMGAAGGISAPLFSILNAEIVPGAAFIMEQLNVKKHVKWADIVITGEGKIDSQTLNNKAPFAVAKIAGELGKPIFAIGGKVESEASSPFDGIYSLVNGPIQLEEAMKNADKLLFQFSNEFAKTIKKLKNI